MLQYLAHGACMAEDAVVLADRVVTAKGDFEGTLHAYRQARYLRTGRVQLTARYYGEAYHAAGITAEVRNVMLGSHRPEQAFEGLGWLYDGILRLDPPDLSDRSNNHAVCDTRSHR